MTHTVIRAKVHLDNTGAVSEIPVILTENGPLMPLVEYMLERACNKSQSYKAKLVQAVGLLLDYTQANQHFFESPKELFQTFVQRLTSGTAGLDGYDPSGLYWIGQSQSVANQTVQMLSSFSDWMADHLGAKPLNPWREATRSEELLSWAAWHHRHSRAFLAHTMSRDAGALANSRARSALLQRTPVIDHSGVKVFPDDRFNDLLFKGFIVPGRQKSQHLEDRLNLRDILITMLMHFGGLRMSEPFHLYVHDILPDPLGSNRAMVRVYHPEQGAAPLDWLDARGNPVRCNRQAYLRGKYAMLPRTEYTNTSQLHAGWKGNLLDHKDRYMLVNWFPTWAGELFWKLWYLYLPQRAMMECDHPYAFTTAKGLPYSIDTFEQQHRRAVERIGLTVAKAMGTTPHAHRHAYGQRLKDAKVEPIFIKKALHHKSLESQAVYTEPDLEKLTQLLNEATATFEQNGSLNLAQPDFLAYGFKDVDPLGLLSGPRPRLLERH